MPKEDTKFAFTVTDWSQIAATIRPGESGQACWRTLNIGDLRVRMVEYTPGYLANQLVPRALTFWKAHLTTELRDGRTVRLTPGMRYRVSGFGDAAHRSSTKGGGEALHC